MALSPGELHELLTVSGRGAFAFLCGLTGFSLPLIILVSGETAGWWSTHSNPDRPSFLWLLRMDAPAFFVESFSHFPRDWIPFLLAGLGAWAGWSRPRRALAGLLGVAVLMSYSVILNALRQG